MNTVICSLCRDVFAISSDELDALGEMVKQMLDVVFSKVNFRKIENPLVCKSCKEQLHESFDFKATCIATEDSLYPYLEPDSKEVDLKCVYVKERTVDTTFKFDENDEVCRFCLTLTKSNTAITLKAEVIKHEQFLRNFMPELMLRDTSDAVICECCHKSLEKYVNFVKSCLDKESKMIQVEETCAYKGNESSTDSLTLASNQLKSDIEIKEEPEFTKNFALEFESLPLKTEQSMDIEEKPPMHLGKTLGEHSVKDEDCSLPISKMEDFGDSIEMQEIDIKPDNGSEGYTSALDGGKNNILQIVSEHENISVPQEDRRLIKDTELEEISKGYIKINEHFQFFSEKLSNFELFYCQICTFQIDDRNVLLTHMLTHEDSKDERDYRLQMNDNILMLPHEVVSEMKIYKCGICTYEAKRKNQLKTHMLTHKDASEIKMFKCEICAYGTKQKYNLITHMLTHKDVSEIKMFKCEICDYEAKAKPYLKRHMLTHRNVWETEMFKCEICAYETKRKYYLKMHILTHKDLSAIKMFKCEICDYEAQLKHQIKRHMLTHKDSSEIEMFKCEICAYEAKRKYHLKTHMLKHKDVSEIQMFQCEFCDYKVKVKCYLKRHMLTHQDSSEIKMFKCEICAFETKLKCNLRKHIINHNDKAKQNKKSYPLFVRMRQNENAI